MKLAVTGPGFGGETLDFPQQSVSIGRTDDNDLVLPAADISRKHARIFNRDGAIYIEDLGSANGTFLDGRRVTKPVRLAPGSTVTIGDFAIVLQGAPAAAAGAVAPPAAPSAPPPKLDERSRREVAAFKQEVHERLRVRMDLKRLDVSRASEEELRTRTREALEQVLNEMGALPRGITRDRLMKEILDEALGLGPLEDLLADPEITEIMVVNHSKIYVERKGKLMLTDCSFASDEQVLQTIERICAPIGRRIDESMPMVDARLKDGSRVNAIIPPLALTGPCLTIRKFSKTPLTVENLIEFGSMTREIAEFLRVAVQARQNIIISGGTGSGKTTLLNVLSGFLPPDERIVTIEDAAELQLPQEHVVSLEARPPNIEGKGAITIRDLVRNALRMRPDRIVVGECRGGEALDMLQAMNTGHDGSLTTVHANTPRDALARIETMCLMSGVDLPSRAIREQIASAVDLIVQQARLVDGSRKITHVTEVTGMEGDIITLQDIFRFVQTGFDENGRVVGHFEAMGFVPRFYETLMQKGVKVDLSVFERKG